MKTKIITLATLIILSLSSVSAGSYTTIKIFNEFGCCSINVLSKLEMEIEEESLNFDTREVVKEIKASRTTEIFDITDFIKPEAEVEEHLPLTK